MENNLPELTVPELGVMEILWREGRALTNGEITRFSTDAKRSIHYIHNVTRRLLKKNAIQEYGYLKEGPTISRTFIPTFSDTAYGIKKIKDVIVEPNEGLPVLFSAMIDDDRLHEETIHRLEELIQQRKQRMK